MQHQQADTLYAKHYICSRILNDNMNKKINNNVSMIFIIRYLENGGFVTDIPLSFFTSYDKIFLTTQLSSKSARSISCSFLVNMRFEEIFFVNVRDCPFLNYAPINSI